MKKYLIILVVLCSCNFTDELHQSADPKLKPFLDKFHAEALKRGHDYRYSDVVLKFEQINSAGATKLGAVPIAKIDPDYFNERITGDEYQVLCIEFTIFHELGHALFSPDHVPGENDLMSEFPPIHDYAKYPDRREEILNRFFK